jgi:gas vesicle protein
MSFIDKAKDAAVDVKDKAGDLVDKIGEKIPDSVKDTAGDFKDKAGDLVDKVKDRLGFGDDKQGVTDEAKERADDVAAAAKEALETDE